MQDTNGPHRLRSRRWFDNPHNPGMTALYLERYMNYGITPDELRGGKPIIGIAQTDSDLSPCNRHHIELASRVRDGIRAGVPLEFPSHPIQETGKRPTAALLDVLDISRGRMPLSDSSGEKSHSPMPHRRQ